jgi:carboxyl-terminal processing protease
MAFDNCSSRVSIRVMKIQTIAKTIFLIFSLLATPLFIPRSIAQQMSSIDRERIQVVLEQISGDIRKYYYDSKLHAVDWDARIQQTKRAIDGAKSVNLALAYIADMIDSLNDSHTFMLPPVRTLSPDYGFDYQMLGNRCFVTHVRHHSDAEKKGIKPGDEVLLIQGEKPTNENLWKIHYKYEILRPQRFLQLHLQALGGQQIELDVASKNHQSRIVATGDPWDAIRDWDMQEHLLRLQYAEFGPDLLVVKFSAFRFSSDEVQAMIDKARQHKALILDLRNDSGGSERTLTAVVGGLFEKEVKIADRVARNERSALVAKPLRHVFQGSLTVLVDSNSGSASELLARVIQIEQRGAILGDHTAGSVMEAQHYSYRTGVDTVIHYGASITEANLIMADGKSLEHVGVGPDQVLIPSAEALARGEDPVLAKAAEQLGVKVDPAAAGKLFPHEWGPE